MKKFNKVLALGMAGSMALSMAACGGSSSSASTGTDEMGGRWFWHAF